MDILRAVVVDLAQFAFGALFSPHITRVRKLPPGVWHMDVSKPSISSPVPFGSQTYAPHTLHEKAMDDVFQVPLIQPVKNSIIYSATANAPLRTTSEPGQDTMIHHVPYGSMLVTLETNGRWARVFHKGVEGWISLDDIADRAAYVYPKFTIGESNIASDPNTERVRAMIQDVFSYGEIEAPLQAEEYVLYRFVRTGANVVWNTKRPRTPGNWAHTVDVSRGAIVETHPRVRSAIEWKHEHGGHIAFVESVNHDGSIRISEANWPEKGTYNERVLVKGEWEMLSPVFIYFS